MRDYIIFLGNGGGRYITSKQLLSTAGIFFHLSNTSLYVDPGPGALVKAREAGLDLGSIDAILCSHSHLDHYNDVEPMLEGAYLDSRRKRPFIAPPSVLGEAKGWDKVVKSYFFKYVSKVVVAEPSKSVKIKNVRITFSPTKHHDPYGVGFVFQFNNKKISYVSDSKYIEELKKYHKDSDVLIAHVVVKSDRECNKECIHATIDDIALMSQNLKPKKLIIRHFGYNIIKEGLEGIEKVRREIEDKAGREVELVRDMEVLFL